MAAAHSTPITLDSARLRRRNRSSGTSGAETRDSMIRNSSNKPTDAPSNTRVCKEVQPAPLPSTMAYTASIKDRVMVVAPPRSNRWRGPWPRPLGNSIAQAV